MAAQLRKILIFFNLYALTATMMFRMVSPVLLPRAFSAFWKKNKNFETLHEIPYFGQGRKMSYEKPSKKTNRVTL